MLSGRRRNGGPVTREAFESDLRREGFEIEHGGQKADFTEDMHAHDFDVRIMVLGGEITSSREAPPYACMSHPFIAPAPETEEMLRGRYCRRRRQALRGSR